jgi:hypothetical protein
MRRALAIAAAALALLTGCADPAPKPTGEPSARELPAGDWPAGVKEAEVYTAVLRRYLSGQENSFPGRTFPAVYVMNVTDQPGPIADVTQRKVVDAFAGTQKVAFIADRATVVDERNGCPQVKDGGILITLGPPQGDDNDVEVHIRGFVACLGASEMTYAVHREDGIGWQVTRTVGAVAVA